MNKKNTGDCLGEDKQRKGMTDYNKITWPVFVIHAEPELIDGLLWIEDQIVDDTNMSGKTLGERRLQTPMKSIYPLRYMIEDEIAMSKHRGKLFIDSAGKVVIQQKTETLELIYHKVKKIDLKEIASVVWFKDIPFPFIERRPPPSDHTWAGILYKKGLPWKIWEYTTKQKKNTWRKM